MLIYSLRVFYNLSVYPNRRNGFYPKEFFVNKFFTRALMVLVAMISFSAFAQPAHTPVGDLNLVNSFGYSKGMLIYKPWVFGYEKTVDMGEQTSMGYFNCPQMIAGTEQSAVFTITATFNPSLLWETEFHRLVAIYGALGTPNGNKNVVNKDDVKAGVLTYLGQWQEVLCRVVAQKSLKELLVDPTISIFPSPVENNQQAPFEIKIQTVRAVLPEDFLRKLALKGLGKPAPAPVAKKPVAKPAPAPAPQNSCCCNVVAVFTPACATNPGK